jgi:hypothetical protein
MRKALLAVIIVLTGSLCVLLTGCGLGLEPVVQLVTNRAELAAYVDRFNALQSDVKVAISYQETPYQAVLDGVSADLVIGESLATPAIMDRMDGVGDLVKPGGKIDSSQFYQRLLAMGSRDNRPVFVPLSFSLPTIVYKRLPADADIPAMFMPMDLLQAKGRLFNATEKGGALTAVGFSPSWNGDFLTSAALVLGAKIGAHRNGTLQWDEAGLRKTVDLVHTWTAVINGNADADATFASRVSVQPWFRRLSSGVTRFELVSFTDFVGLPEEERRDFDFRWLAQGGASATDSVVPVLDNVLFAGVLRSARNKSGARAFLQWFCTVPVQQGLLGVNQSRRIGVFGVTNGFSALKTINERDLPQKYTILLGHVPLESFLAFPETLADNWVKVRDGVIEPWILDASRGSTQTLESKLSDWQEAQKK